MVTNDGATILKNIGVDNPAAKVLVGESQDGICQHLETVFKQTVLTDCPFD